MTPFHFVAELILVLIALGMTHILTGIAKMIHVGVSRWSPLLIGWTGLLLHEYFNNWFFLWTAHDYQHWTYLYVVYWFTYLALIYIAAWLIMPETHRDEAVDQGAFYDANRRKFLGAMIGFSGLGSIGNMIGPNQPWYVHWQSWNIIGMFSCMVTAWIWADKRVQYGALIVAVALSANYAINGIQPIAGAAGAG